MGYDAKQQVSEVNEFMVQYGNAKEADSFMIVQRSLSGIASMAFKQLASLMEVSGESLAQLLGANERTFRNYMHQKKSLDPQVSEHILRIADLFQSGLEVFGSKQSFNQWLQKPAVAFDHMRPWELMHTSGGVALVQEEVQRIAYGDLA